MSRVAISDSIRVRSEGARVMRAKPAFTVLKRCWVVERTFAWLGNHRRLSKDYEFLPETEENIIYLAMSRLMLRRLCRPAK